MTYGFLPAVAAGPSSLDGFVGTYTKSSQIAERSLSAVVSQSGEDRETRISLSERAVTSLRQSEISLSHEESDSERFSRGVDRAARRIGRSIERLLGRLERLQDRAERIGERLTERILEDIEAGRFDDRTQDKIATRLLRQAGRLERAAERITERLVNAFERLDALDGDDDGDVEVDFAQSISLSVKQVEIEVREGDTTVKVSVQQVVFETTGTLGIGFAEEIPEASDSEGDPVPTASLEEGVYLAAPTAVSPEVAEQAAVEAAEEGGEAAAPAEAEAPAVPAEDASALLAGQTLAGQGVLVLLQSTSFSSQSFSLRFDLATRTGSDAAATTSRVLQASSTSIQQQSQRLLSIRI